MTITISGLPSLTIPTEFFVGVVLGLIIFEIIHWATRGRRS